MTIFYLSRLLSAWQSVCHIIDVLFSPAEPQIILYDTFRSNSAKDIERVQVLTANHALDVIISPEETVQAAEQKDLLISTPGMLWSDEISFEDHESGRGPEKPYILDITKTEAFASLTSGSGTKGYLGAVLDSSHEKGAEMLIGSLLGGRPE